MKSKLNRTSYVEYKLLRKIYAQLTINISRTILNTTLSLSSRGDTSMGVLDVDTLIHYIEGPPSLASLSGFDFLAGGASGGSSDVTGRSCFTRAIANSWE